MSKWLVDDVDKRVSDLYGKSIEAARVLAYTTSDIAVSTCGLCMC